MGASRKINTSTLVMWAMAAGFTALGGVIATTQTRPASQTPAAATSQLEVLPVQRNVYAIFGAGGNIVFEVGPQGIVVVDTGDGRMNDQVVAAIRTVSDASVRFIINTSIDLEHAGGNEGLNKALGDGLPDRQRVWFGTSGAEIVAHEQVLLRMSKPGGKPSFPTIAWPTSSYFSSRKDLYLNEQAIQLYHLPAAFTDGDTLVYFRGADVIVPGDIFDKRRYPLIDAANGGSIFGVIDGLNKLLDISVGGMYEQGGTMIVPGHGRICDEADVVEYRDMLSIIRDRIEDLVKKGQTLEQVKAKKPTLEYDPMYGSQTGPWTTDMFVEAVYRDVVAAHKVVAASKTASKKK